MVDILANAVRLIIEVVRQRRSETGRLIRPLGLFLLTGPNDAEAIHIARVVAESAFGDSGAVLRFEMSEYKEKYLITKLIGPPPAMVGFGPPGLLTEMIRLNPDRVILLEGIEQAHMDAQIIVLEIAQRGSLVDNFGRQVDFRETVLLMTIGAGVPSQSVILPDLFDLLDGSIDCRSPRR
jgi:ATP-dependent Clp protease ATP-binding subunit ClpA